MPQESSGSDKSGQRAGALIGAAAVVLAAVVTGVFTLLSHEGEVRPGAKLTAAIWSS